VYEQIDLFSIDKKMKKKFFEYWQGKKNSSNTDKEKNIAQK